MNISDNNAVLLREIIDFLGDSVKSVHGDPNGLIIKYLKPPAQTDEFTLDWINPKRSNKQSLAEESRARAILVDARVQYSDVMVAEKKVLVVVASPRDEIAKVGSCFFVRKVEPYIHPSAVIHQNAKIGNDVFIGANSCIDACEIGDDCIIENNVSISASVTIKQSVTIHAGAVIGTDGLGCSRDPIGLLHKFPHLGGLIIESDVEIGANSSIARGSLSDTVIGRGTKINSLCFIAHNCILGENVLITGCSMLNGSVTIGNNSTIFSQVIIRDQCTIGEGSMVGMGSVVTKSIPDRELWMGNPARFVRKLQ